MLITCCPKSLLPADVLEFLPLADHADAGHLPVAGGVLDQTKSFMQALRYLRAEDARWRAQLFQRTK